MLLLLQLNEVVIGNVDGILAVFKGDLSARTWKRATGLGTVRATSWLTNKLSCDELGGSDWWIVTHSWVHVASLMHVWQITCVGIGDILNTGKVGSELSVLFFSSSIFPSFPCVFPSPTLFSSTSSFPPPLPPFPPPPSFLSFSSAPSQLFLYLPVCLLQNALVCINAEGICHIFQIEPDSTVSGTFSSTHSSLTASQPSPPSQ